VTFAEGRYYLQALAGEYLIEGGRELGVARYHGLRRGAALVQVICNCPTKRATTGIKIYSRMGIGALLPCIHPVYAHGKRL
jgi:hypothetical protein